MLLEETTAGILSLADENRQTLADGLMQAAEGALNENVVYSHLVLSAGGNERVMRYRDADRREVNAVVVDRVAKVVRLYEVKSKSSIDHRHYDK